MDKPSENRAVRCDVFISHASEDKNDFVRAHATELDRLALEIWYDEWSLGIPFSGTFSLKEVSGKVQYSPPCYTLGTHRIFGGIFRDALTRGMSFLLSDIRPRFGE